MRNLKKATGLVLAVAALAMLSLAPAASAHYTYIYHGSDKSWLGDSINTPGVHDHLGVVDHECDGNGVYAEAYAHDSTGFYRLWDANGCQVNESNLRGVDFYRYRLCEQNVSCTAWKDA